MQLPPDGVYAVTVTTEALLCSGVCNIGVRPTVDTASTKSTVEVHLFDVSQDFVGKELSMEFVKFLRSERKFNGLDELQEQISRDCFEARKIFSA